MTARTRWFAILIFAGALPLVAGAQPKLVPPPSDAALSDAKEKVAEIYRDEHAKAKTLQQKLALVEKLRTVAQQTQGDPTGQYALLVVARDIAAGAGDWEATKEVLAQLQLRFDVDVLVMADDARAKIDGVDKPPRNPRAAYAVLIDLTSAAIRQERYDIAERMIGSAQRIVRRGGDAQTLKQLTEYAGEMQKQRRQFEALKPALAKLEIDPADAAANEAVGRYRALAQGNWDEGIPMLALGSDVELAKLAGEELVQPTDGAAQLALADGWWALAEQRKAESKPLRRHALDWYLRASHQLDGLKQRKALARLEEVEKWHSKEVTYVTSGPTRDYDRSHPPLPSLLSDSDKYHVDSTQFAFHLTGTEAYITIDLKRDVPISRLHIFNRLSSSHCARGMTVHVSSSPQQRGKEIWRVPNEAPEWDVRLPKLAYGRYVTIAIDPSQGGEAMLHLRKVKIYGPE